LYLVVFLYCIYFLCILILLPTVNLSLTMFEIYIQYSCFAAIFVEASSSYNCSADFCSAVTTYLAKRHSSLCLRSKCLNFSRLLLQLNRMCVLTEAKGDTRPVFIS